MAPPRSDSSRKHCSKPAGEMISRMRHGSSPAFQNVCHWLRGLCTRSPGPASTTSSPRSAPMRPYRMTRRAELEAETRLRITESAIALHERLGPARTTVSAIAELAGVRRSTVYRHYPDEEALFDACASHWRAANPPPDPRVWEAIDDPVERTEAALRELYAFFDRTRRMYASLFRDEALVPIVGRRLRFFYDYLDSVAELLMQGRGLR